MILEEVRTVVDEMDEKFDSHEFIKAYILRFTKAYGSLLVKHENVTTAHAEISNYLRNHADELGIEKVGAEKISKDIFGNDAPNAEWRKK